MNLLCLDQQIVKHIQDKPYSQQMFPIQAPGEDPY